LGKVLSLELFGERRETDPARLTFISLRGMPVIPDHVFDVYVLSSRYLFASMSPVAQRRYSEPGDATAATLRDRKRSMYHRLRTRTAWETAVACITRWTKQRNATVGLVKGVRDFDGGVRYPRMGEVDWLATCLSCRNQM
jgi:hypothetical protein